MPATQEHKDLHKANLAANKDPAFNECCGDHDANHVVVTQADRQAEGHPWAASSDDHIYHTRCKVCGRNHIVGISPVMTTEETLRAQLAQYDAARELLGIPPAGAK